MTDTIVNVQLEDIYYKNGEETVKLRIIAFDRVSPRYVELTVGSSFELVTEELIVVPSYHFKKESIFEKFKRLFRKDKQENENEDQTLGLY
jgi:hypothetical protein